MNKMIFVGAMGLAAVGEVQGISIGTDIAEKLSKAVKVREQERPRKARPVGGS